MLEIVRPIYSLRCGCRTIAFVVLAGSCGSSTTTSTTCAPSPFRSSPPKVIAHAGGEGLGPANTVHTMKLALAAGADLLDVDVRMTSDGVVVGLHDRNLREVTGTDRNIDQMTWSEVQSLDARVGWTGSPIADRVQLSSLEEILTAFPDVTTSIEIKQSSPAMATQLCDVIRRTNAADRVYLSANEDADVYAAQAECPPTTIITTTYRDLDEMRAARSSNTAFCWPAPIGQPPYREDRFSADDVAWTHDHGGAIFTWTVDDPATLRRLAEAGVDGVYTRRPDVARRVFDEFAADATEP